MSISWRRSPFDLQGAFLHMCSRGGLLTSWMRNMWSLIFYLGRAQPPLSIVLLLLSQSIGPQGTKLNRLTWGSICLLPHLYTVGGNAKWCGCYGKKYGGTKKNRKIELLHCRGGKIIFSLTFWILGCHFCNKRQINKRKTNRSPLTCIPHVYIGDSQGKMSNSLR